MKEIRNMSIGELAAFICTHLKKNGIDVVLSGGACITIYTDNKYESFDLDFIENVSSKRKRIADSLKKIGFKEENRYFINPETKFFIEFPSGPLSVGEEPVKEINTIQYQTGELKLISPTDCVKDRLAAYYHWQDQQSLEQAISISERHKINLKEIERWSKNEGMDYKFQEIKNEFKQAGRREK